MSVFKCKMCGGNLEVNDGMTVCECEYCGSIQTLPKTDNDVTTNLYNRANNLRMKNEFDKAQEIYEKIVSINGDDSEAYWGIVLCKFGIEYVEDPATYGKVPTCHRTQLESVLTDVDYLSAIEQADAEQKAIYEAEAREIDRLQKEILNIVHNEEPFDVFICYKETDENGRRTPDSVIANEIYHQLTQEGFKVFYAAITLEDKLGQAYEPYVFAALNSSKIMLTLGTKPEYFSAVWVKNEWSRYLKIMKKDRKKLLIPCYRDMDAYDLPEEFSHLQAQDMSKIGFINDVIRGIRKVTATGETNVTLENQRQVSTEPNVKSLIKNAEFLIEEKKWDKADEYCDEVLRLDPSCAVAYLLKIVIGDQKNKDIKIYGKRLEEEYPEITELEIEMYSSSKYMDYFWSLAKAGAVSKVKYIISIHPDILIKEYTDNEHPNARSILNYAIVTYKQFANVVDALLKCGVNPNSFRISRNSHGEFKYSALSDAINEAKNVKMVELLLEAGVNANQLVDKVYDDSDYVITLSLLTCAVTDAQSADMVRILLKYGANPNSYRVYRNNYGETQYSVLSDAIRDAQNVEMIKLLLEAGADANRSDEEIYDDGSCSEIRPVLINAITTTKNRTKTADMVRLLLQYGANPNSIHVKYNKFGENRFCALTDAICYTVDAEIVKLLLEAGADANRLEEIIYNDGTNGAKSMLTHAIVASDMAADTTKTCIELLQLLLKYGATWDHVIKYAGKSKIEYKFPYNKVCHFLSNSVIAFMRSNGWKGSIF